MIGVRWPTDAIRWETGTMIDTLREAITALDGVIESPSMFRDDLAYWVHGKEIAHFEDAELIEIRLPGRLFESAARC